MKNYINLAIFFVFLNSCVAQSPVLDIATPKENFTGVKGAYYKDTKNILNGYDGTYVYTSGTTIFKIKLQKNIMTSRNGQFYEDLVVGEYQLIENGIEKVNTLNQLTTTSNLNNIRGKRVLTGNVYGCSDCKPDEKRLRLGFIEATSPHIGEIDIRKTNVNGKEAIIVKIWYTGPIAVKEGAPLPKDGVVIAGKYTMIKQ
ncbi:DUF6705 family protein [Flavobacterium sp. Fl-318]|uniref:DUF6705 family protein n=1 Tax=Flavobacterium cupriresistens TaxID=2893885 RepID=A0ABU4RBR5_9FLAO|nr:MULTISPECIES: DUF6705 family protein [unclassified Flavobacterium]MDX6188880.1 DUF6705 family protein [Flavobacterium sp. Fl-318]UFH44337.1 hypothetical protein LNP23_08975 [Flavobacterium sp. F-323]